MRRGYVWVGGVAGGVAGVGACGAATLPAGGVAPFEGEGVCACAGAGAGKGKGGTGSGVGDGAGAGAGEGTTPFTFAFWRLPIVLRALRVARSCATAWALVSVFFCGTLRAATPL